MHNVLNYWRFYGLKREQYYEGVKKAFKNNLHSLRLLSMIFTIFTACSAIFPVMVEQNKKAFVYIIAGAISLLVFVFVVYKIEQQKHGKHLSNLAIYLITVLLYINIMMFCVYLGVWSNPDKLAVTFMSFLICTLFLFINPPIFNLFLTLSAFCYFSVSSILSKAPDLWIFDVANALVALVLSLFFGWQITMMRIRFTLDASKLEDERNSFYDLSTIDELTQLKNRRDFMHTFKRFLSSYRQSDHFLCVAIMDIDFFKDYNDHYGHPKGDECLRIISDILKELHDSMSIYAARVGGEEFAMMWFEKEASNANRVTEQIEQKIRGRCIPHEKSKIAPYVTASIGVHIVQCGKSHDIHTLYDLADKALYTAKNNGRNCTVFSSASHCD